MLKKKVITETKQTLNNLKQQVIELSNTVMITTSGLVDYSLMDYFELQWTNQNTYYNIFKLVQMTFSVKLDFTNKDNYGLYQNFFNQIENDGRFNLKVRRGYLDNMIYLEFDRINYKYKGVLIYKIPHSIKDIEYFDNYDELYVRYKKNKTGFRKFSGKQSNYRITIIHRDDKQTFFNLKYDYIRDKILTVLYEERSETQKKQINEYNEFRRSIKNLLTKPLVSKLKIRYAGTEFVVSLKNDDLMNKIPTIKLDLKKK